jgi:hypothetical protein
MSLSISRPGTAASRFPPNKDAALGEVACKESDEKALVPERNGSLLQARRFSSPC